MTSYLDILLKNKQFSAASACEDEKESSLTKNMIITSLAPPPKNSSSATPSKKELLFPPQRKNKGNDENGDNNHDDDDQQEGGGMGGFPADSTSSLLNNNNNFGGARTFVRGDEERLRGIQKHNRETDFDDSKVKPWSERWTREHRGKRVGSCTRRIEHGNSGANGKYCPCCRQYFGNRQWRIHEPKKIVREAEKKVVAMK